MTKREAMEVIMQVAYDGEFTTNGNEAFGIACEALEKQIPKKLESVTVYDDDFGGQGDCTIKVLKCNKCGYKNIDFEDFWDSRFNYCPSCGQKLDWNVTNNCNFRKE